MLATDAGPGPFAADTKVTVAPDQMRRTHGLYMLVGLGPWNVTSGLFAQLPLLVAVSPQHSQLASFMDIATNLANLPMLCFIWGQTHTACARRCVPAAAAARCCPVTLLQLQ